MKIANFLKTKMYYFKKRYMKVPGKISLDSELGKWISLLSSTNSVQDIVEIGVWNGRGSSKCILQGLNSRDTQAPVRVIGLESSKKMYEEARRELRSEAKYLLLWGTVIDSSDKFLEINQLSELESV